MHIMNYVGNMERKNGENCFSFIENVITKNQRGSISPNIFHIFIALNILCKHQICSFSKQTAPKETGSRRKILLIS